MYKVKNLYNRFFFFGKNYVITENNYERYVLFEYYRKKWLRRKNAFGFARVIMFNKNK